MSELSLIVPVFNEEISIEPFLARVIPLLENITTSYEVLFCLDPSTDQTASMIESFIEKNDNIRLITLSRRFGQAEATFAGIEQARGQYLVTLDVDLQDPPELIEEMLKKGRLGFDVVYSKRLSRVNESFLKLQTAKLGYAVMSYLSNGAIEKECGDYRLFSRRVAKELCALQERHLFLRAQIPLVGFKSTTISYHRQDRAKGEGHYNQFFGSIKMGLDGIFCFSAKPLLLIFFTAVSLFVPSLLWFIKEAMVALMGKQTASSTSYIIASISFFSSLQLFSLSLMSEYIARILTETQRRPRYIIDKIVEPKTIQEKSDAREVEVTE